MASLQIEVASSSSQFSYSLRDHNRSTNIKGYIHPQCIRKNKADDDQDNDCDSSWLPSQNSKAGDDDSWLPATSRTSTVASGSDRSGHRKGHNEVDESWLPATNDAGWKCGANTHEYVNDIDYSWLPSTFTDNHQKKHKHDNINDNNKNKNKSKNKNMNNNSTEKEKIRVVDVINKLSREEEITASGAGGNGNESKPEEKRHKRCVSKTLESNNRLDIMDLRKRFNSEIEKGAAKEVDFKTKTKTKTTSSINIANKKEEENDTDKKQAFESFEDWMTNEYSQTCSDMDEDECYNMQLFGSNYDWIGDISRPKSDWEDMRQARYREMLNRSSGSADIHRLLERKSVSSFLSSSLRDLIDQLITSRIQQSTVKVENQEVVVSEKAEPRKEEVLQEEGSIEDEFGDCRSTNDNDRPCSEYCETPYSERSWRPNDGVYSSETATTITSPSLDRSLSSNRSHNNNTPQSSSGVSHRSIEMELAYDLIGHMEQLQQEIVELRRSIKSCVNMQIKMHHSYKQNAVIDQATRSVIVPKKVRKPLGAGRNYCFICDEKEVDSLLYRCGHMCTCFICGIELQKTSGECPFCDAPIMDVVNVFAREN